MATLSTISPASLTFALNAPPSASRHAPRTEPTITWKLDQPDPMIASVLNNQTFRLTDGTRIKLPFVGQGSDGVAIGALFDMKKMTAEIQKKWPDLEPISATAAGQAQVGQLAGISAADLSSSAVGQLTAGTWVTSAGPIRFGFVGVYVHKKGETDPTKISAVWLDYFVDTDVAQRAGEELWGLRKYLGSPNYGTSGTDAQWSYGYGGSTQFDIHVDTARAGAFPYSIKSTLDIYTVGVDPDSVRYPHGQPKTVNSLTTQMVGTVAPIAPADVPKTIKLSGMLGDEMKNVGFRPFSSFLLSNFESILNTDMTQLKNPPVINLAKKNQRP